MAEMRAGVLNWREKENAQLGQNCNGDEKDSPLLHWHFQRLVDKCVLVCAWMCIERLAPWSSFRVFPGISPTHTINSTAWDKARTWKTKKVEEQLVAFLLGHHFLAGHPLAVLDCPAPLIP